MEELNACAGFQLPDRLGHGRLGHAQGTRSTAHAPVVNDGKECTQLMSFHCGAIALVNPTVFSITHSNTTIPPITTAETAVSSGSSAYSR